MVGGRHGNHPLLLVDFVEESPITHAVSPGWRFPILQALDVGTEVGIISEDGIDVLAKFGLEALLRGGYRTARGRAGTAGFRRYDKLPVRTCACLG